MTSRGIREEGVPGVEIETTWYGAAERCRCGEALPGSARDITFVLEGEVHRPCFSACRRDGEQRTGWPARDGKVLHVKGYRILADRAALHRYPLPWARHSAGPFLSGYPYPSRLPKVSPCPATRSVSLRPFQTRVRSAESRRLSYFPFLQSLASCCTVFPGDYQKCAGYTRRRPAEGSPNVSIGKPTSK